jgi:hypothetical protein
VRAEVEMGRRQDEVDETGECELAVEMGVGERKGGR